MKINNRISKMVAMVLVGVMSFAQSMPLIWAEGTAAAPPQEAIVLEQPVIQADQMLVDVDAQVLPQQDPATEFLQYDSALEKITVENQDTQTLSNETVQEIDANGYLIKESRPDGTVLTFDWENKTALEMPQQVPGAEGIGYIELNRAIVGFNVCNEDGKCRTVPLKISFPQGHQHLTSYQVEDKQYVITGKPEYVLPIVEDGQSAQITKLEEKNITTSSAKIKGYIEGFDPSSMRAVLALFPSCPDFAKCPQSYYDIRVEEDGKFSMALQDLIGGQIYNYSIVIRKGVETLTKTSSSFETLPVLEITALNAKGGFNVLEIKGKLEGFDPNSMNGILKYRQKGSKQWTFVDIASLVDAEGNFALKLEDVKPDTRYEYKLVVKESLSGTKLAQSEIQTWPRMVVSELRVTHITGTTAVIEAVVDQDYIQSLNYRDADLNPRIEPVYLNYRVAGTEEWRQTSSRNIKDAATLVFGLDADDYSGLTPATKYEYQIVGPHPDVFGGETMRALSEVQKFATLGKAVAVDSVRVKAITSTNALIKGVIKNFDSSTMLVAIGGYMDDENGSYGDLRSELVVDENGMFKVVLEDLVPEKKYLYWVIVQEKESELGLTLASIEPQTFETLPVPVPVQPMDGWYLRDELLGYLVSDEPMVSKEIYETDSNNEKVLAQIRHKIDVNGDGSLIRKKILDVATGQVIWMEKTINHDVAVRSELLKDLTSTEDVIAVKVFDGAFNHASQTLVSFEYRINVYGDGSLIRGMKIDPITGEKTFFEIKK